MITPPFGSFPKILSNSQILESDHPLGQCQCHCVVYCQHKCYYANPPAFHNEENMLFLFSLNWGVGSKLGELDAMKWKGIFAAVEWNCAQENENLTQINIPVIRHVIWHVIWQYGNLIHHRNPLHAVVQDKFLKINSFEIDNSLLDNTIASFNLEVQGVKMLLSNPCIWCLMFGIWFLVFIGPRCPWGPIFGSGCHSVRDLSENLTDVTLADEDTNSILTDNANRAIQGNVAMQVMQPGDQCKLCHLPIGQSKAMWLSTWKANL